MSKVLEIAASHVGYTEGTNNDTEFGKWYGLNNQPWCAMSASKIFFDAGEIASVAPKTKPKGFASCDEWLKYLAKNNQLVPIGDAQRGDLVFYQFDEDAQPDHVGIIQFNNKTFKTINAYEGNTSGNKGGSQANGDGFYLKKRGYGTIMAVGRPKGKA
jgi:hypothetical protein